MTANKNKVDKKVQGANLDEEKIEDNSTVTGVDPTDDDEQGETNPDTKDVDVKPTVNDNEKEKIEGDKEAEYKALISEEMDETVARRKRIANDVFNKNTRCKTLFFTADLVPFFMKNDAIKHGATLKDDTIVTINKE